MSDNIVIVQPATTNVVITSPGPQGQQGVQGITGAQGTQGVQGLQGAQGTTGIQGAVGTQGTQGVQGNNGVQGITGTQGTQGLQGNQGTQGLIGSQGVTGTQGTQGLIGLQGATGTQGAVGLQGAVGAQGTTGTQGLQGRQGTIGIQGTTGTQGLSGNQGTTGTQGIIGLQGVTGIQGSVGIQGTSGTQGTIGAQGVQGIQGLQGLGDKYQTTSTTSLTLPATGTISFTVGANLSYSIGQTVIIANTVSNYIIADVATYTIGTGAMTATVTRSLGVGTFTSWSVNLDGAVGIQGVQGSLGNQGTIGAQGTTGLQGVTGTQGLTGLQGFVGLQGVTGSQGVTGLQGFTGTQGTIGTQGATGTQGLIGIQGTTGTTGNTGLQGTTGAQGTIGQTGLQGLIGLQGNAGTNGANGAQGTTGSQGTSGTNGTQGIQGTQGVLGIQGLIGSQGVTGADALPSQTGNAGKLLGTNGTAAAWTSNLVNPNIENGLKAKIAVTGNFTNGYGYANYDGNALDSETTGLPGVFIGIQNVGNIWLAARDSGSGSTIVYSSTDGITWNFLAYISGFGFSKDSNCKVAYNGSVFVVSGSSGQLGITTNITDYASVATPPTFTDSNEAYRATISSYNGYFFLPDFAGSNMFYSSNGNTWNSSSLPTTANWSSTAYGAGKYVVVANDSATAAYATSPSGTWTSITMPSTGYQSVIYDGSKFIAMGSGTLATSTNGTTWTSQTFTETGKWNMAYSEGGYVAACVDTYLTYILTSADGITWSQYEVAGAISTRHNIGYIKSQAASGTLNIMSGSGTNGQVVVSTGVGVKWGSPADATPTVPGTVYGQISASNDNTTGIGYGVFDSSIFDPASAGGNTAVGTGVLKYLTSGVNNSVFGSYPLSITTGAYNTLMGINAGYAITTGEYNTAIGGSALGSNTGSNNVGVGYFSGGTNTSNSGLTAIGYFAGAYNDGGANCTYLGSEAGNVSGQFSGYTNQNITVIGATAKPSSKTVSNEITLGNSSIATIRAQVTSITALSDERDKTAIEPLAVGLDFINELKPVQFEWNMRDGAKVGELDAGFIAQDLVAAEDATGLADYLQLTMRENPEKLEATQGRLIPILVKAIQELSAEVKALKEGK